MKEPKPPYGVPPKQLRDAIEETRNEIFAILVNDENFNAFIEMVDQHSTGILIETLFGSEKEYIDTPGNYHTEKQLLGYTAVQHFIDNHGFGGGRPNPVLAMYAWYVDNFFKVHAWMSQVESIDSDKVRRDE